MSREIIGDESSLEKILSWELSLGNILMWGFVLNVPGAILGSELHFCP